MYDYDLFAVINHDGQLNNGHYTNFARYNNAVSGTRLIPPNFTQTPTVVSVWRWEVRLSSDKFPASC